MEVGYKIICDCGCKDTTVIREERIKHTTDDGIKLILYMRGITAKNVIKIDFVLLQHMIQKK